MKIILRVHSKATNAAVRGENLEDTLWHCVLWKAWWVLRIILKMRNMLTLCWRTQKKNVWVILKKLDHGFIIWNKSLKSLIWNGLATNLKIRSKKIAWKYEELWSMMTSSNGNIFRVIGHLCGNSPVTGEFTAQRPVTRSFDVFLNLRLNKCLSKQLWGRWFETPSRPLWHHCNENIGNIPLENKVLAVVAN